MRANIILLAAQHIPSYKIARQLNLSKDTVGLWRRRYLEEGYPALKAIRRGVFSSVAELERAIAASIRQHNAGPKPFKWTKSISHILKKQGGPGRIYIFTGQFRTLHQQTTVVSIVIRWAQ